MNSNDKADWLVWDANGRLWWKQDGKGYTRHFNEAGRFTESDAIRHQMSSDLTAERHDIAIPLSALTSSDGKKPDDGSVTLPADFARALAFVLARAICEDSEASDADRREARKLLSMLGGDTQ